MNRKEKSTFEDKLALGASITLVVLALAYIVACIILVISLAMRVFGMV